MGYAIIVVLGFIYLSYVSKVTEWHIISALGFKTSAPQYFLTNENIYHYIGWLIAASIIFSFHYVWINKYEFVPNKHGKTSFTVINKWTGKACMAFVDMDDRDAIEYRVPALCDSE